MEDASTELFHEMRRITLLLRRSFTVARVEELDENVAAMSRAVRRMMNKHPGIFLLSFLTMIIYRSI